MGFIPYDQTHALQGTGRVNLNHPHAKGIVGYWAGHHSGGTTLTDLVRFNDLTLQGNVEIVTGPHGGPAVALDGTNDYAVGTDLVIYETAPLFIWVWFQTSTARQEYVAHKIDAVSPFRGWVLGIDTNGDGSSYDDGYIALWNGDTVQNWLEASLGVGAVHNGEPHMIAGKIEAGQMTLFWDGNNVASVGSTAILGNAVNLNVGQHAFNLTELTGQIWNIGIRNDAPSDSEVWDMWNSPDAIMEQPRRRAYMPVAAAAGGLSIPVAMNAYRQHRMGF